MMNTINVIFPFRYRGTWVFDDAQFGLVNEAFISGADKIIDRLVEGIPNAEKGFRLIFSSSPFPEYTTKISWEGEEYGGNWYFSEDFQMEGWLCPALFHYFEVAPKEIYIKAEEHTDEASR